MIGSATAIFNLALNSIGSRSDVSSVDERSREAEVCRLWYPIARDTVLQAAFWPGTKAFARLSVLAERTDVPWTLNDPEPGYRFAYAIPTDLIQPRYLTTMERFTTGLMPAGNPNDLMPEGTDQVRALFAQTEGAVLIYTKSQTVPILWDPQLALAIAFSLAAYISMPLHAKVARAKEAAQMANDKILQARISAANSEENQYESIPEWISARGYAEVAPAFRYTYPLGPMISVDQIAGVN